MMWRRNIHSLLTLAAELSKPDVGSAVQPQGWLANQGQGVGALRLDLGPEMKQHSQGLYTHRTFRKKRAAGMVPAFALLQKKSQVHFAGASNATSRSHQDRPKMGKLSFYIMHKVTKAFSVTMLVVSALELHYLSGERAEFSYTCSVPVSQLKCKPCVGHHAFVSVYNTEQCGSRC